jgi:hypothetical protein
MLLTSGKQPSSNCIYSHGLIYCNDNNKNDRLSSLCMWDTYHLYRSTPTIAQLSPTHTQSSPHVTTNIRYQKHRQTRISRCRAAISSLLRPSARDIVRRTCLLPALSRQRDTSNESVIAGEGRDLIQKLLVAVLGSSRVALRAS